MTRARYPVALPGQDVPFLDGGFIREEWRDALEALVIQAGGQGGDALYDQGVSIGVAEQLASAQRRLTGLESDAEQTRSLVNMLTGKKVTQADLIADTIYTRAIKEGAVSVVDAESTASAAITSTNPKRTNSQIVTETIDLTSFVDGAEVLVWVDALHSIDLGAFDWCVMRMDVRRYDLGGGTNQKQLQTVRWVQAGSSSNGLYPSALQANGQTVTEPFSVVTPDTLPVDTDSDYNADGYTYQVLIYVTSEWDDGSTMLSGYDTPSSNSNHHRIADLDLILLHLKR